CGTGRVCETMTHQCVECVTTADCGTGRLCIGQRCTVQCQSDVQCASAGAICNVALGICVQCLDAARCGQGKTCSGGRCVDAVCQPGDCACGPHGVAVCMADGAGYVAAGAPETQCLKGVPSCSVGDASVSPLGSGGSTGSGGSGGRLEGGMGQGG